MQKQKLSLRESELVRFFIPISLFTVLIIVMIGGYSKDKDVSRFFTWTGFGDYTKPSSNFERGKTLWDWMELLIVPGVLAGGALWFNRRREELERAIEDSRMQEESLQSYLDRMTDLLLNHKLSSSQINDVVRSVAEARTLSVLGTVHEDRKGVVLNEDRKGLVLGFLCRSKLVNVKDSSQKPIIRLEDANLRNVNLSYDYDLRGAYLAFTDLRESQLQEAKLNDSSLNHAKLNNANLRKAELTNANLRGANLREANLEGADLKYANLHEACLDKANLKGADLKYANLKAAHLREANLEHTHLKYAYYSLSTQWPTTFNPTSEPLLYKISPESDLTNADLRRADFGGTDLSRANLKGAKLQGAFLGGVNLQNACLEGAELEGALYTNNNSPEMLPPLVTPTLFPDGFDPKAAGMILVTTPEALPKWYRPKV